MSEVRMNQKPQRFQNKESTFFLTCNYQQFEDMAYDYLIQDMNKLKEALQKEIDENRVELAVCWEERGFDTGNIHWHGIIKLPTSQRKRFQQFKQWLVELAQLKAEPHVEACRSIIAAIKYKDKPEKSQAWAKWSGDGTAEPAFFVLIRLDCSTVLGPDEETILKSYWQWQNLTKKL